MLVRQIVGQFASVVFEQTAALPGVMSLLCPNGTGANWLQDDVQ